MQVYGIIHKYYGGTVESKDNLTAENVYQKLSTGLSNLVAVLTIVITVIIDYLFIGTFKPNSIWLIIGILFVVVIMEVLLRLSWAKFLTQPLAATILYNLLVAVAVVFVLPLNSPYDLLVLYMMYQSAYWLGRKGFIIVTLTYVLAYELNYLVNFDSLILQDFYVMIAKLALLFAAGSLTERQMAIMAAERDHILSESEHQAIERERLLSLINSMADGVIATDSNGKIILYNGAALDLVNTNQNLENKPLKQFIDTRSADGKRVDIIAEANKSDSLIKRDDLVFKNTEDEQINLYVSVASIYLATSSKDSQGFICILRDITKEKSIEEQRDEFISVVSHELRTPIAITEANISTAMLPNILKSQKKAKQLLEQAHHNIVFLADMVNDITTLAHAERGTLTAEIEIVDAKQLLDEVFETYKQEASDDGLELIHQASDDLPVLHSNNYRIKEIIQNFVTNAIKYTEKGSVTIKAERAGKDEVRFSVIDTGIGLSKSDQKHVFDKFWRSEDYRTRSHNGTGLGLHVAKKLAERMQGTVGVESKLNKGTTFWLQVPSLKKVNPEKSKKQTKKTTKKSS